MKKWGLVIAALAATVVLAGCGKSGAGSAGGSINITTSTMAFSTKEISLAKGQPVKLVLNNKDATLHDFSIDKIPAQVKAGKSAKHDDHGKEPDLHVAADPGKTGIVEFTPTESGTYTYYCTVAGHKEAGMVGTLVVK